MMPSIAGLSWARLQREGAVTYPVAHENDPGHAVVFTDQFPTPTGKARLVPAALTAPAGLADLMTMSFAQQAPQQADIVVHHEGKGPQRSKRCLTRVALPTRSRR